ncbi:heme-binding protein soul2 [Lampris incognitus]|uniref:heme-binding protein soul2 n=1 Tax=Lampris incognitus TaxID=2546036 RepID=UPI0024B56F5E|nr:heme-binding protein soul2 [Lampris incognitus]
MEQQQLLWLAFAAFLLGEVSEGQSWTAPDFCHGYECPQFTEVSRNQDYEERRYLASRWISTKVPSTDRADLTSGFYRLKDYCNGKNEGGAVISMKTWPALISVTEGGDGSEAEVSVSWFAPANTSLPKPTDSSVTRETRPAANVYIRVFGGLANHELFLSNLKTLREVLVRDGKSFEPRRYTAAGYDSLFDILHPHHNEAWISTA